MAGDRIVYLVGSSIAALWQGLDRRLADECGAALVNLAVSGTHAFDWLPQMRNGLYRSALDRADSPAVLLYYCGSNDVSLGCTAHEVADHVVAFLRHFRQKHPAADVVFLSVIRAPSKAAVVAVVDETNRRVVQLCSQLDGPPVHYVDLNSVLVDAAAAPLAHDLFEPDDLHLTDKAYSLLNDVLMSKLAVILKPTIA